MKISLALALLIGAAPYMAGQEGPKAAWVGQPLIQSIESVPAPTPDGVEITGVDLGLVWRATLDGIPVPIRHNTGTRLVIEPGPWEPGFARLALDHMTGTLNENVEFLPSLKAERIHGRFRLTLNTGGRAFYWIDYSFGALDTPISYPGIYYHLMLDMTAPYCGTYVIGGTKTAEPVVFPWETIPEIGLLEPLRLQAMCYSPDTADWCFSNVVIPR